MNKWEVLLGVTIVLSMIYAFDDLFIDFTYWVYSLRRYVRRKSIVPLRITQLVSKPEQRVAILIPCWQENDVVGESLRNTMYTLQYENFDVFVGLYPNDPETLAVVETLQDDMKNLHTVVCPNPGPTSKADNLNSIIRGMRKYEKSNGVSFEILVLHDADAVRDKRRHPTGCGSESGIFKCLCQMGKKFF
jgi:adsorption protein B